MVKGEWPVWDQFTQTAGSSTNALGWHTRCQNIPFINSSMLGMLTSSPGLLINFLLHGWILVSLWFSFFSTELFPVMQSIISYIVNGRELHYCDVIMNAIASQITSVSIFQSSTSLAFLRGIHRGPVNSLHKRPVTRKMFPFDDIIMNIIYQSDDKMLMYNLYIYIYWLAVFCGFPSCHVCLSCWVYVI